MEPEMHINRYGEQEWYLNDILHRTDGPAVIWPDGSQQWFTNGERHRIDGPAVILADGYQAWYINDKCHRTDGPAIIWPTGKQAWHINGKHITREVERWMQKQDISWPWNEEIQAQFALTFC
jgi:hypothetical protein